MLGIHVSVTRVIRISYDRIQVIDTRRPATEKLLQTGEPDPKHRSWVSEAKFGEIESVRIGPAPWDDAESSQFTVTTTSGRFVFVEANAEAGQLVATLKDLLPDRVEVDSRSPLSKRPLSAPEAGAAGPRRRPGSPPFRSPLLGWALKILSVAAVLGVMFVVIPHFGNPAKPGRLRPPLLQIFGFLLVYGALLPMYVGYRLCLRTIVPFRHGDPRPPVVFLRAFDDDDRISLQPSGRVARFHGLTPPFSSEMVGLRGASLLSMRLSLSALLFGPVHPIRLLKLLLNADRYYSEELFASVFRRFGPFVAIGRPGERLAVPGAERMYVGDDEWQRVVLGYLADAQLVILQPSKSPGVRWEVEQVLTLVPLHKVLLCFTNFHNKPDDYDEFRRWVARRTGIRLPMLVPFLDRPCLVYFTPDGAPHVQPVCYCSPVFWPFLVSGVDAGRTFRPFAPGTRGATQELPAIPRRHYGHKFLSVLLVFGLFFGVVGAIALSDRFVEIVRTGRLAHEPPPEGELTEYRGKAFAYTFRVGSRWKPQPLGPDAPGVIPGEYLFQADDDELLAVFAQPGTITDIDQLTDALRSELALLFAEPGKRSPAVALRSSGRVTRGGGEWLDLTYTVRREGKVALFVRGGALSEPSRSVYVLAVDHDRPTTPQTLDQILDSFELPRGP